MPSKIKREIVRVLDADVCCDVKTGKAGKAVPCLQYEHPRFPVDPASVLSRGGADATLEELVGLCDQHAESINAHDFCGTHRLIGAVLYRKLGRTPGIADRGQKKNVNGTVPLVSVRLSPLSLFVTLCRQNP